MAGTFTPQVTSRFFSVYLSYTVTPCILHATQTLTSRLISLLIIYFFGFPRCGNVASILELDEHLAQEYKVFQHASVVRPISFRFLIFHFSLFILQNTLSNLAFGFFPFVDHNFHLGSNYLFFIFPFSCRSTMKQTKFKKSLFSFPGCSINSRETSPRRLLSVEPTFSFSDKRFKSPRGRRGGRRRSTFRSTCILPRLRILYKKKKTLFLFYVSIYGFVSFRYFFFFFFLRQDCVFSSPLREYQYQVAGQRATCCFNV